MTTLAVEASTYAGSVVLADGARILAEQTVAMRGREHEALMPAVAAVLRDARVTAGALTRIVCGSGPGAFTSLRIAGGIAKGLALSLALPLYPVSSLALLAAARPLDPGRYLAALDAMRGEHYVQPFVVADGRVEPLDSMTLLPSVEVGAFAHRIGAVSVGPGQPGALSIDPHARGVSRLTKLIEAAGPADLAGWEPAYGRLAEAQVKWEATHGRPLVAS